MKTKDIVIIGLLGSLLFSVQVGLAFLPNIELVSLLIIVYTKILEKKTIYVITIFILLEGFFYGFGLWWINYLYIWFILYFVTLIFRKERSHLLWAIVSGAFGLSFGALCSIPYFFMGGVQSAFAYWISGIPYDIPHGLANFFLVIFLFKPLVMIMERLDRIYHISTDNSAL